MEENQLFLFEAKKEFTKLLCYHMQKSVYQGILSLWNDAKAYRRTHPHDEHTMYQQFQLNLKKVKIWNHDIIEDAYQHVIKVSGCDFLEDLIKKVFVLNTQLLASVGQSQRRIKVYVPKGEKFVHHCYQECAKVFYEQPWLFEDRSEYISKVEQSMNLQKIYKLITVCIENKIKTLLPISELLKEVDEELDGQSKVDKLSDVIKHQSEQMTSVSIPQTLPVLEPESPFNSDLKQAITKDTVHDAPESIGGAAPDNTYEDHSNTVLSTGVSDPSEDSYEPAGPEEKIVYFGSRSEQPVPEDISIDPYSMDAKYKYDDSNDRSEDRSHRETVLEDSPKLTHSLDLNVLPEDYGHLHHDHNHHSDDHFDHRDHPQRDEQNDYQDDQADRPSSSHQPNDDHLEFFNAF
ncbi:hypothetical protein GGF32_007002 [Allomyces javanicus]|nr:hypothetical protein GGF32_007002 [Allomyces javanicus]